MSWLNMSKTTTYEAPDAAAVASQAVTDYQAETDDVLGEKMVLNMGPSHPATHGVLRLVLELDGEIIEKAEPHIGYLHRGDEKIAENMTYNQFVPYTDRLDYLAPLANNAAYAMAVEKLANLEVPERCQAIRVVTSELARISAHLLGLGAYTMDVGALTVFMITFTEREKLYKLFEELTGARFTTSYSRIGGVTRDMPEGWTNRVLMFCEELLPLLDDVESLLTRNRIWFDRTADIGIISKEDAIAYGLTGPNLRGSGVDVDLRRDVPDSGYEQYEFEVPLGENGDCYDRYLVRVEEMRQSNKIIKQCIDWLRANPGPVMTDDKKVSPPQRIGMKDDMESLIHHFKLFTEGYCVPAGEAYAAVEAPKGEFGVYLVSDGANKPYRVKIRAPGFSHLSAMSEMVVGHMLADVVAVMGTMDVVFGEIDR